MKEVEYWGIIYIFQSHTDVCTFSNGYGQGGIDEQIGRSEHEQSCAAKVKSKRPTAIGATFYPISKKCYAEYGPTIQIKNVQFYARACKFSGIADFLNFWNKTSFLIF